MAASRQDHDRLGQGAKQVRRAGEFGIHSNGLKVNLDEVVDRKDRIVEPIRCGSCRAVDKNGDLDLIEAHGRFTGAPARGLMAR